MLMLLYSLIIVDNFIFWLVVYTNAHSFYQEYEETETKRDSSVICT